MNIAGGTVGPFFVALDGSTVNISGGTVSDRLIASSGSVVTISGGTVGDRFISRSAIFIGDSDSDVTITGGEFRLDVAPVEGLETVGNTLAFNFPSGSLLSGTLADGTPFAFSSQDSDSFSGTLTLDAAALPPVGPPLITLPADPAPLGILGGQTLVVEEGGLLNDNFGAGWGSTVQINAGQVGRNFEAVRAQVTIAGGTIGNGFDAFASSVVNISGGTVGNGFDAFEGSTVTISGGSVGDDFNASGGSVVNISGGTVGDSFDAISGSTVSISGGAVGDRFIASGGSVVTISGGDFRLDGVPVRGLETVGNTLAFNLPSGSLLSGTLADGTPFAFSNVDIIFSDFGGDSFANGTLTLKAAAVPIGPPLITLPADPAPLGIRGGQTLVVEEGGLVGDSFGAGWGSTVQINAGQVGDNFEALRAQVTISGGTVGNGFDAFAGSTVTISGGSVGDVFHANSGSAVTITGGEFRLDGVPVEGLETVGNTLAFNLPSGSLLSGTLADGTPFAFSSQDSDFFTDGTLTLEAATSPPVGPAVIMLPADPAPLGVHSGQTLVVEEGGLLGENFNAGWGSTVQINAGQVGNNFEAVGAHVTVSGGTVGAGFDAFAGSTVTISGGSVGGAFLAESGSTVNISGGTVGDFFRAENDSTINISGGSVGDHFTSGSTSTVAGSIVNISGGSIGDYFRVFAGSVNWFGTQFILDGNDLTGTLSPNVPLTITDRNVTLSGVLADGSPFSIDLDSNPYSNNLFDPNAILTITLILPGDYNGNGIVDAADYAVWRNNLGRDTALPNDPTPGTVTDDDYLVWKANFGHTLVSRRGASADAASSEGVPEPACALLCTLAVLVLAANSPRRRDRFPLPALSVVGRLGTLSTIAARHPTNARESPASRPHFAGTLRYRTSDSSCRRCAGPVHTTESPRRPPFAPWDRRSRSCRTTAGPDIFQTALARHGARLAGRPPQNGYT